MNNPFPYICRRNCHFTDVERVIEGVYYCKATGYSRCIILINTFDFFTCLCQDLDNFSVSEWMKYKDILTDEDLDAVRKLGVIVKLAYALNASKKNVISDVVCDILGDSIIMKTIASKPSFV